MTALVMLLTSGSVLAAGTFCTELKEKFPLLSIQCPTNQPSADLNELCLKTPNLCKKVDNFCTNRDGSACTWYNNNRIVSAPEIDAASGTSAIALLTGIVLLMRERTRAKRSSETDGNSVN